MRWIILIFLPALAWGQDYQFSQEWDSILLEVNGITLSTPWTGGYVHSCPDFYDWDADGDLDLLVGCSTGKISWWENQGSSLLADFQLMDEDHLDTTREFYSRPEGWDMDSDGDVDLLVAYFTNPRITVYRNVGNPITPLYELVTDTLLDAAGERIYCQRAAIADLDGDGDDDLLCGENPGHLFYYANTGDSLNYHFTRVGGNFGNIDVGEAASPVFCDLDADGDYDLCVGNKYGQVWYYRNTGTPQQYDFTLVSDNWLNLDVGDYAAPEFADLDSDGDFDLILGKDNDLSPAPPGALHYWENTGTPQNPSFVPVTQQYLTFDAGRSTEADLCDIDADGDLDLFFLTNAYLGWLRNAGTAQSPAFRLESYNLVGLLAPGSCAFLDLDGDPHPDLVTCGGWGGVLHYWQAQLNGSQLSFTSLGSSATGHIINCLTAGDVDGDGGEELLVGGFDYSPANTVLALYENNGTPGSPHFVQQTTNWQGLLPLWELPSIMPELADVDRDGDEDLLLLHISTGAWRWYQNVGTPQAPVLTLADTDLLGLDLPEPAMVTGGDVDGDEDLDYLGGYLGGGGLLCFRNTTGDTSSISPYTRPHLQRVMDLSLSPQPGNPTTSISFQLPFAQEVDLAVYNLQGARVATLASGRMEAGSHTLEWEAKGLASGVYLVRLKAGGEEVTKKLTILK
ncbi:MAG: T9SS C-terminal target domain-containing protein [Candidatus Zixiibacteriota bacterium]|nr:MAG: T9SS C-terminal target domain-containing protein [candidate division Zixibacteria bacterium]